MTIREPERRVEDRIYRLSRSTIFKIEQQVATLPLPLMYPCETLNTIISTVPTILDDVLFEGSVT